MKKALWIVLAVLVVGLVVWRWRKSSAGAASDEEAEVKPVAAVQVGALQTLPISLTLTAFGVVEAAPTGAKVETLAYDAVVDEIAAPVGSRLAAGDEIMKVEPTPDAKLQIESAKGASLLAQHSLQAVRQRYELKLATSDDLHAAEQAASDARLKVESYQKRGMGGPAVIRAPWAGIVVKLDPQPGMVVPAGTALAILSDGSHLQARFGIEATDTAQVKAGQSVAVSPVEGPESDPVNGAIASVGAVADAATGSVDVRVPLPDGGSWLAGERVQGAIVLQTKTALVAPRSAVLPDDEQQVLYTVKNHKAVKHVVQTGIASGDLIEVIAKDLAAGDQVVTQGNYELEDGMDVRLPGEGDQGKADDKEEAKP